MMLIENEIVFIAIPKCASISIHSAFEKSDVKIEPTFLNDSTINLFGSFRMPNELPPSNSWKKIKTHNHQSIPQVYSFFNKKIDTITIKRDYCKRFISSFYYFFGIWIKSTYKLNYIPNKITNDFIYEYFTDEIVDYIKSMIENQKTYTYDKKMKSKLIIPLIKNFTTNDNKNYIINSMLYDNLYVNYRVFDSQEAWKGGHKPTYEFDIRELYKFEEFIKNKYDKEIKILKDNQTNYKFMEIDVKEDQKLRDWVWNKFEKSYFTKKIF